MNDKFPSKWIGRGRAIEWSPQAIYLYKIDYVLILLEIYLEDLEIRITAARRELHAEIFQEVITHNISKI